MADGQKSQSKSPGLSSKFQRMYKALSPNNPPWKEAYRKVLFVVVYPNRAYYNLRNATCQRFGLKLEPRSQVP